MAKVSYIVVQAYGGDIEHVYPCRTADDAIGAFDIATNDAYKHESLPVQAYEDDHWDRDIELDVKVFMVTEDLITHKVTLLDRADASDEEGN